jgi:cytochrome d ubiquinol oxidase subunit II
VGVALPAVVAGFAAEALALLTIVRGRYLRAHAAGVSSAALVLWGWFVAQSPRMVGPRLTLHASAAPHTALVAVTVSVGAVLALVIPAMFLLFSLFNRPVLEVIE